MRLAGGIGSENADMSSDRRVRTSPAESPRVPAQGQSAQGEPAPKARAKAVVDGNRVNIPWPPRCDDRETPCLLIGLEMRLERSRKQHWDMDRTRNRHRWTG